MPLALGLAVAAAAAAAGAPPGPCLRAGSPESGACVYVQPSDGGPPVAPNFVGLSIEVGGVLKMIGAAGDSAPLATLLRHLHDLTPGPHPGPTLRFGGNSADNSAWLDHPDAPLPTGCNYGITQRDLSAYVNFASRTAAAANVSLIIDTNFGTSTDPRKLALPHIKAVVGYPGLLQHVSAVEIGNEMDVK